ncbi:TapB family protein [Marinirhabdus gelatinilytica]|uniref:DUF3108 domain-containing protein n=1 Tax=Marinirhabdus gelatinilytica TaxID=1703343 RepID=A0A370Q7M2_9FLAO|nr:hypothetical protein [Marinirhabdus gelatinilytica]RDK84319.1 hypothetical protein C8D94_105165 [Marinirhabdus gelatinilytica]
MKKHILTIVTIVLITFSVKSQSCSAFYPFEEGATFTITSYSKKDKVVGISEYRVSEVSSNSATMTTKLKDKNGEVLSDGSYKINCNGDGISMDVESLLNPQLFEQFKDFETDISGTGVVLPNNLSVGQELPDATMSMKINMGGINMNMDVMMTDRKVVGKEKVTTPAGTFDCYVITYTSDIKMGMNRKGTAKQWIAKGVGMVKQEDYNKKGKVTSSSLLTAYSK